MKLKLSLFTLLFLFSQILFSQESKITLTRKANSDDLGKVSVNLKNKSLQEALNTIASSAGVNLIITPSVKGVVPYLKLVNERFEDALKKLAAVNGFSFIENNGSYMIGTKEELLKLNTEELQDDSPVKQEYISLRFNKTTLQDALNLISKTAGINLVLGKSAKGSIENLELKDIYYEDAMNLIAKMHGLFIHKVKNTYLICSQRELQQFCASHVFKLHYIKVHQIEKKLHKLFQCPFDIDNNLNAIVVFADPDNLRKIQTLIESLDVPVPLLKAKLTFKSSGRVSQEETIEVVLKNGTTIRLDENKENFNFVLVFNPVINEEKLISLNYDYEFSTKTSKRKLSSDLFLHPGKEIILGNFDSGRMKSDLITITFQIDQEKL